MLIQLVEGWQGRRRRWEGVHYNVKRCNVFAQKIILPYLSPATHFSNSRWQSQQSRILGAQHLNTSSFAAALSDSCNAGHCCISLSPSADQPASRHSSIKCHDEYPLEATVVVCHSNRFPSLVAGHWREFQESLLMVALMILHLHEAAAISCSLRGGGYFSSSILTALSWRSLKLIQ